MDESNAKFVQRGVIEAFQHDRLICGWAYAKDTSNTSLENLNINAYSPSGELINSTVRTVPRPDLDSVLRNNKFGFQLDLLKATPLEDLDSIQIKVSNDDGTLNYSLNHTAAFSKRIQRAKLQKCIIALADEHSTVLTEPEKQTLYKIISQKQIQSEIVYNVDALSTTQSALGSISSDGISILGKEGYFFLFGGSNNLDKLYKRTGSSTYLAWTEILGKRLEESKKRDMNFVQVIIPEKQSMLPELYPFELDVPTENFELLQKSLPTDTLKYVVSSLENNENAKTCFKKTDTHFTSTGARAFTEQVLHKLGLKLELDTSVKLIKYLSGDLGNKYQGPPFYETIELLESRYTPELVDSFDPEQGRHIGIMRKWKNDNAPFKYKVIAFGNSFFERGTESTGLSWWFSRLFSEFHFYWDPECDWQLVDSEKPDVVVCQTIERFLPRIPKS